MRVAPLLSTLALSFVALASLPSWAYRDYFTPEQKALLEKIQTVRIEAIALADQGAVDTAPIAERRSAILCPASAESIQGISRGT